MNVMQRRSENEYHFIYFWLGLFAALTATPPTNQTELIVASRVYALVFLLCYLGQKYSQGIAVQALCSWPFSAGTFSAIMWVWYTRCISSEDSTGIFYFLSSAGKWSGRLSGIVFGITVIAIFFLLGMGVLYLEKNKLFFAWMNHSSQGMLESAIIASVLVILFWISQGMLTLWENTDEYWISSVLNGLYSTENYCHFVSPTLAALVKLVDAALPYADGVALIKEVTVLTGIWCVFYILSKSQPLGRLLIGFAFLVSGNFSLNLLHLPFTSLTALHMLLGVFLCYAVLHDKAGWGFACIGGCFLISASMWRYAAFLLCLPFVALLIVKDIIHLGMKDIGHLKQYIFRLMLMLLPITVLCCLVINNKIKIDQSTIYSEGIAYNAARSSIVDYPQKDWADIEVQMQEKGISENDFTLLKTMILADTSIIDTEFMNRVADDSSQTAENKLQVFFQYGLKARFLFMYYFSPALLYQLMLLLVILLIFLFSNADMLSKLALTCCYLGAFVIACYYTYLGHLQDYLLQSILFAIWCVWGCIMITRKRKRKHIKATGYTILGVIIAGMVAAYFCATGNNSSNLLACLNAKSSEIADIVGLDDSGEAIYIWGVYDYDDVISQTEFFYNQKLMSLDFTTHNLPDGEWEYGQPYYTDYLKRIGVENPMQALLLREHTYYVGSDGRCQIILTFLREHYDSGVTVKSVGTMAELTVWEFYAE